MPNVDRELARIAEFLTRLDLSSVAQVDASDQAKDLYRKFHALLCWQTVLKSDPDFTENERFEECLSDFSAGYLFLITSAYKPSIASVRSGIENLVRSLLLLKGVSVDSIDAVWELFSVARAHFVALGQDPIVQRIDALHSKYGELCKTVHSADVEYMSLRVPFERVFEFDEISFGEARQLISDTFRIAIELIFLVAHEKLVLVHHRIADEIRDALSPSTKALVG